eukprot:COSAG02_NODE_2024_length_10084_cov_130.539509_7_plen_183_part_00
MYSLEEDAAKQLEDRPGGKSTIKLVPPPHVGMPTVGHIEDAFEPESEPETSAVAMPADAHSTSEKKDEPQQQSTSTADAAPTTAAVTVARRRDGSAIAMDESGQPLDLSVSPQLLVWTIGMLTDAHFDGIVQGVNSWSRRLGEVSISELLQTMAVNAAAPFVLCSRLKSLLSWRGADESACT